MQLPFFYIDQYDPSEKLPVLDEINSRHMVQASRMQPGNELHLTDGNGHLLTAEITEAHKKHSAVKVVSTTFTEAAGPEVTLAISLLKNISRFEWFLEKTTEIGVSRIVPLVCARTEKQKVRHDRLKNIMISAMLQSRQTWLPKLHEPISFDEFIQNTVFQTSDLKYIAHCIEGEKQSIKIADRSAIILVGPEGDFTPAEIDVALQNQYQPVTLGNTRLRTETAGIVAATLLKVNGGC